MAINPTTPWAINYAAYWRPMSKAQADAWVEFLGANLRGGLRGDQEADRAMAMLCDRARRDDPAPHVTDLLRAIIQLRAGEKGESYADKKARFLSECRQRIDAAMVSANHDAAWEAVCDGDQAHGEGLALEAYAVAKGFDRGVSVAPMVREWQESLSGVWRATA